MSAPLTPEEREARLQERLERIEALEKEVKAREKALKKAETAKKQLLLRLSPSLWDEIAACYKDICGLEAVWVDKEDYLRILNPDPYDMGPRWQLEYARLFTRVTDNSKILAVLGMRQSELTPLYDGLRKEISRCPKDTVWPVNAAMDEYLAAMKR